MLEYCAKSELHWRSGLKVLVTCFVLISNSRQGGEGSRPRDPSESDVFYNLGRKYTLGFDLPSRRAGIRLRRAEEAMNVKPPATSDRQRALPELHPCDRGVRSPHVWEVIFH